MLQSETHRGAKLCYQHAMLRLLHSDVSSDLNLYSAWLAGRCGTATRRRIQAIDLLRLDSTALAAFQAPWFQEALECITGAPYLNARSPEVGEQVVRIGRALLGIGGSCRQGMGACDEG